jgi:hypothetical protein
LGIGDWGLGIGDWGLGPIPNPQSPFIFYLLFILLLKKEKNKIKTNNKKMLINITLT